MHPYFHPAQRTATVIKAVLSVLLAFLINNLGIAFPWWFDAPAVFGVYGLVAWLYNHHLWHLKHLRTLHKIPYLAGAYDVSVRGSYDEHATVHNGLASIRQSWTHLSVTLQFTASNSVSTTASILTTPEGHVLQYMYTNEPRSSAPTTMNTHRGAVTLSINENSSNWAGEYFTGRGRMTHGELHFRRKAPNV